MIIGFNLCFSDHVSNRGQQHNYFLIISQTTSEYTINVYDVGGVSSYSSDDNVINLSPINIIVHTAAACNQTPSASSKKYEDVKLERRE